MEFSWFTVALNGASNTGRKDTAAGLTCWMLMFLGIALVLSVGVVVM